MLKLFRIFQGCFTVQLSRFFAVVLVLSSNFYIISLLLKFVNNFFIYFSIFRLKLCVSCCLCQTASLYYHPLRFLSTAFLLFLTFFAFSFPGSFSFHTTLAQQRISHLLLLPAPPHLQTTPDRHRDLLLFLVPGSLSPHTPPKQRRDLHLLLLPASLSPLTPPVRHRILHLLLLPASFSHTTPA